MRVRVDDQPMTTYGLVLFDDAEELDFVGPWEVFTSSCMALGGEGSVVAIAEHDRPIRCAKGLRMLPDHTFTDHPPLDVVLVPGGQGTRREVDNPVLGEWLRGVAPGCTWITSVCTGSLVLWGTDVARDRRLATHWGFEDELEAKGAKVVRGERWVVDGNVVSSQGVSAGIDMALWLIGQLHGADHARTVQHYIQYDPAPPYAG